jgi:type III pantothenate kinase
VNLVAVNLGNTRTRFGFFRGPKPVTTFSLATPKDRLFRMPDELEVALRLEKPGTPAALVSTVPALVPSVVEAIRAVSGLSVEVLEYSESLRIRTCYPEPRTLGMDRVMKAAYVREALRKDSIVVDVGTAATVDAIMSDGEMRGGAILPGPLASMYGLARTAAQLSEIDMKRPRGALGCSTDECIRAGVLFGLEGALRHLIEVMTDELRWKDSALLFTGGGSGTFRESFPEAEFDPDLTLKGIYWAVRNLRSD